MTRQRDPDWLERVLRDASQRVAGKPDWGRSEHLRARLREVEELERQAAAHTGNAAKDPQPPK